MTGARTPGRTHGAVPAAFVSRSAEIRAARRSAGARRLLQPQGRLVPLPPFPQRTESSFAASGRFLPWPFPQACGVFQNRTAATRPCAFPQAAASSGNGREMVAEMRAEPIAYHAWVPRNKNDPRRRAGGRENAPNFPFHPFSASGEIIPIGERPPSLSF